MFSYSVGDSNIEWVFELKPDITDRLNYMAVEESKRSLSHLVFDMDSYVGVMNERWARRPAVNERAVRKLCEKMLKWQQKHLSTFSAEVATQIFRFKKIRRSLRNISRKNSPMRPSATASLKRPRTGSSKQW